MDSKWFAAAAARLVVQHVDCAAFKAFRYKVVAAVAEP
jgi:hypothetical protein